MSSVSLGKLQWEIEMRLRDAEDTINRIDGKIVQTDRHWDDLRANMSQPIDARINLTETSRGGSGGTGGGVGGVLSSGGAGSSILPPRVDLTGSRGAGGGGALSAWAANPTMQAAYRGNPQAVANAMAQQLGVAPSDVMSMMTGGAPGGTGGTVTRRQRDFFSAQGNPSPFGGARDALVQSYGLDALDGSIPQQMKRTQEGLRRDTQAADEKEARRASRVAVRDQLQMDRDMKRTPLSDYELRTEQMDRIGAASNAAAGAVGAMAGAEGATEGNWLTRPLAGSRALRYSAIGLGVFGGLGIGNAFAVGKQRMAMAGDNVDLQARAQISTVNSAFGAVPILGGFAQSGANGIADALGATGFGRRMGFGGGDAETTMAEAQQANAVADLSRASLQNRRDNAFGIGIANAGMDSDKIERLKIDKAFEDAKTAAQDFGGKMREAGESSQQANAEVKRQTDLAGKLRDAQAKQLDAQETFSRDQIGGDTGVLTMRLNGQGHDADRTELQQHYDQLIHANPAMTGLYAQQRDVALSKFDSDRSFNDSSLLAGGNAAARAYGLQGQGMGFSASMVNMQQEQTETLNRLGRLFGTGSAEYVSARTRFGAQSVSAFAEHDRSVADFMGSSQSATAIAGFNASGDVYGAQHAALENERRHRLQFEAPEMADPRDPKSLARAQGQINSEIDARDAAAKQLRARGVNMFIADMDATTQGNNFAAHDKPITGQIVEGFDKFVNQFNNVQGSPDEQKRIRASMGAMETSDLKRMQHTLEFGEGAGHAGRIEAGQTTHRSEDSRYFSDMAQSLKMLQSMLAAIAQNSGAGHLNIFTWKGGGS